MTHEENPHVLIFEEIAGEEGSLAGLLRESRHLLQKDHVSEAGKRKPVQKTVTPEEMLPSSARVAFSDFSRETA